MGRVVLQQWSALEHCSKLQVVIQLVSGAIISLLQVLFCGEWINIELHVGIHIIRVQLSSVHNQQQQRRCCQMQAGAWRVVGRRVVGSNEITHSCCGSTCGLCHSMKMQQDGLYQ